MLEALRRGKEGSLARHLLIGATGSAGVQLTATLFALVTSVILARLLGPSGYGAYAFAFAVVNLLGVPAVVGFDQLTVREISAFRTSGAPGEAAGLLTRADQLALAASVLLALAAGAFMHFFGGGWDPLLRRCLLVGLPAVPFVSLIRVRQGALQGLRKVVQGQLPEGVVLPVVFLGLVGLYELTRPGALRATSTVGLHVAAAGVTVLVAGVMLTRRLPRSIRDAEPEFRTGEWVKSGITLLFVAGLYVVNSRADTVMLAGFKGAEPVGIYNVASRGAGFVGFFLMAGQRALAPTISGLHEASDHARLQEVVTAAVRIIVVLTLPVAAIFVFAGEWIITLIYGASFAAGAGALAILAVAYLAAVATGPVSYLLMMTGFERDAATGVGVGALLNVSLNALLIPRWSVTGAAVATGASMVVFNGVLVYQVYRRLGIRPTVLAGIGPFRGEGAEGGG